MHASNVRFRQVLAAHLVRNYRKNRGVRHVCMLVRDEPKGLPTR
jgi:hypothetical protein